MFLPKKNAKPKFARALHPESRIVPSFLDGSESTKKIQSGKSHSVIKHDMSFGCRLGRAVRSDHFLFFVRGVPPQFKIATSPFPAERTMQNSIFSKKKMSLFPSCSSEENVGDIGSGRQAQEPCGS